MTTAVSTPHPRERRRQDLRGRIARATYPARQALADLDLGALPCRLLGHRWVEVPASHLSQRARQAGRMRFKCARCFLMGGFSN